MTDMSVERELNQALGDFAERRGQIFFARIQASHGGNLRQGGRFIAIDAMSGEFVSGDTRLALMDHFRQKFGERSVAWIVDLEDARCQQ